MIQTHCISVCNDLAQKHPLAPKTVYDKGMKNETASTLTARFDAIMARVDEWAENNEIWGGARRDAEAEVEFCLFESAASAFTDDEIFETACDAWAWSV
jgi:hypothetical protein